MKLFTAILSVVFFTTAPTVLLAKDDTLKITIEGTGLPSPIEISNPGVRQFNIQRLPNQDRLTIKVLEGEDGVNIIQKNTAVKPVVEVRDRNNLPVAGATVVFILPDSGPSAAFADGSRVLTVRTNSAGRASASSMHPVGMGAFNIGVTASLENQVVTATIAQTNFATIAAANAATASGAVPSGASIATGRGFLGLGISTAVVGAIAAGAAAAVTVAVVKKGPPAPKGTIGVGGGPVFGPSR